MNIIIIIAITIVTALNVMLYSMILWSASNYQNAGITHKQGIITALIAGAAVVANVIMAAALMQLI